MTPLDIAYQQPRSASVFLQYVPTKVGNRHGGLTMKRKRKNNGDERRNREEIIQERKARKERYMNSVAKTANTNIVVATLIATVTFAAGITLPGGYQSNENQQGMPILLRKSAFKAFVVTDAIGFVCSIVSIIGYIRLVEEMSDAKRRKIVNKLAGYSIVMLDLSLAAVVLAFVLGMFAVLTLHSSAVAVGVCVAICLCILALIAFSMFLGYNEEWWIIVKFHEIVQFFNKL
ncbi:PREDICTED: ankyrin repeat-containing protein NPR4-like [Ipomoea nil]|uniref:ankyrin repeat-containing protein NPR4-like n=1 Tax=Ipomoea nil TaxID=35883 RepID=UPI000901C04D|nr:PREDICTED: ankyrin repeat-containing protein NPR4-like [Ipomoea nil]